MFVDDIKLMPEGAARQLESVDWENGEFVVRKIKAQRWDEEGKKWFLVEWEGYESKVDFTWEDRQTLEKGADQVLSDFEKWNGEEEERERESA